jgi:hypothetical protein
VPGAVIDFTVLRRARVRVPANHDDLPGETSQFGDFAGNKARATKLG